MSKISKISVIQDIQEKSIPPLIQTLVRILLKMQINLLSKKQYYYRVIISDVFY